MSTNLYDLIAEDQLAIDNKWIFWYDNSPEVKQRAVELQKRMHEEFLMTLKQAENQK